MTCLFLHQRKVPGRRGWCHEPLRLPGRRARETPTTVPGWDCSATWARAISVRRLAGGDAQVLQLQQPGTILDAMTLAPEAVKGRYGVPAVPLRWLPPDEGQGSGRAVARKSLVKVVDTVRIASWVRRHDVVMIPGMGVLETALPQRPWQGPYNMLVLCAAGRIFGTKVALVCVGANLPRERLTRWLFGAAGRLAFYRSYRTR